MANWNIQSISYPNPLAEGETEWEKLEELVEFESYAEAREMLTPPEHKKSTRVETGKAAYESFGLLWVDGDRIRVTPGGQQYVDAVRAGDERAAAWVGLNLLVRCPLAGPRRNWSNPDSDLPIYWGILAVMLDLGGELHWEELGRVLSLVTERRDLGPAVETIRALRDGTLGLNEAIPPGDHLHRSDLYNRLNMAMHHVGLGHLLTERIRNDQRYAEQGDNRRVERIRDGWQRQLVEAALGGAPCGGLPATSWVDRVPAALAASGAEERFEILGAAVPPQADAAAVASGLIDDEMAWLVDPADVTVAGMRITAPPARLCQLAKGDRVAMRGEAQRTFIVKNKQLGDNGVEVTLRSARRISNPEIVENAFKEIYDA